MITTILAVLATYFCVSCYISMLMTIEYRHNHYRYSPSECVLTFLFYILMWPVVIFLDD